MGIIRTTPESEFLRAVALGYDASSESAFAVKANWKRVSKSYFHNLQTKLSPNQGNIWFNAAGPATSGEINMQLMRGSRGFHLFGNLDAGKPWFIVRFITGLSDYTGGSNFYLYIESMEEKLILPVLASYLKGNCL